MTGSEYSLPESYHDLGCRWTAKALGTPFVKGCLLTRKIVTCFKKSMLQRCVSVNGRSMLKAR